MNHQDSSNPQPKRSLASSPSTNEHTRRNAPRFNDKTYAQRHKERLAQYRASREQDLEEAFDPTPAETLTSSDYIEDPDPDPGPLPAAKPQVYRIPKYEVTEHHAPLSDEAIAGILLQCQPNSPKAQAWINAHKASKIAKERMEAQMKERDGLRKHVLQLRPKSEWTRNAGSKNREAAKDAEEMKEEDRERIPPNGKSNATGVEHRGIGYAVDEEDEQIVTVLKSSGRLQILLCDHEEPAVISGRIKREIRTYFGGAELER
ncbi:hypothetical protein BDW62DRAFT_198678 [Aspergillus aurantiobrunneus]